MTSSNRDRSRRQPDAFTGFPVPAGANPNRFAQNRETVMEIPVTC